MAESTDSTATDRRGDGSDGEGESFATSTRERFGRLSADAQDRYRRVSEDVRRGAERASSELRRGSERAREQYKEVSENLKEGYERASGNLKEGYERAKEGYDRARSEADDLTRQVSAYVRENPGKSVLMAAGVGFLVGLLFRGRGGDEDAE